MFLAERAARLAERDARIAAEAEAVEARSDASLARSAASANEAMITYLQLMIEKLKRELYGQSSERGTQKLDHLQLQLEECEAEDEVAAILASSTATPRRRPVRKPFTDHLPRERAVLSGVQIYPPESMARISTPPCSFERKAR